MSLLISTSKFGDCSVCYTKNTNVVKRGKLLVCLGCKRNIDTKKQLAKQRERVAVRTLVTYQKDEGIIDSIQELTIDLDRVVSRYVRLAAMEKDHRVKCFTCMAKKNWKLMQCGHFVDREHKGLRWDLRNNKPQCKYCNIDLDGNLEVYAANLEKEQKGIVEQLREQSRIPAELTRTDLKQLLFDFQQKLKLVEAKIK